jgi:hypothetical protein
MRPALLAMNREDGEKPKGAGKLGADGKERLVRAMMDINFDSDQWLAQFRPGDPVLARVLLAADPVSPSPAGAQGVDRLRQLVLDPVYQLK